MEAATFVPWREKKKNFFVIFLESQALGGVSRKKKKEKELTGSELVKVRVQASK